MSQKKTLFNIDQSINTVFNKQETKKGRINLITLEKKKRIKKKHRFRT